MIKGRLKMDSDLVYQNISKKFLLCPFRPILFFPKKSKFTSMGKSVTI